MEGLKYLKKLLDIITNQQEFFYRRKQQLEEVPFYKKEKNYHTVERALKIYKRLLEKGEINDTQDKELYFDFKDTEVRSVLDTMSKELEFHIFSTNNSYSNRYC